MISRLCFALCIVLLMVVMVVSQTGTPDMPTAEPTNAPQPEPTGPTAEPQPGPEPTGQPEPDAGTTKPMMTRSAATVTNLSALALLLNAAAGLALLRQ